MKIENIAEYCDYNPENKGLRWEVSRKRFDGHLYRKDTNLTKDVFACTTERDRDLLEEINIHGYSRFGTWHMKQSKKYKSGFQTVRWMESYPNHTYADLIKERLSASAPWVVKYFRKAQVCIDNTGKMPIVTNLPKDIDKFLAQFPKELQKQLRAILRKVR